MKNDFNTEYDYILTQKSHLELSKKENSRKCLKFLKWFKNVRMGWNRSFRERNILDSKKFECIYNIKFNLKELAIVTKAL